MADEAWKKLNAAVKAKRVKKCAQKPNTKQRPKGEELIVQRLSSQVSGKPQKYTRIGPREFVPFEEDDEITIDNIKHACEKHFSPQIGKIFVCDVLAGDQGPSCKTVSQMPDFKVIYVRFIPTASSSSSTTGENETELGGRKRKAATEPFSSRAREFPSAKSMPHSSPSKLFSQNRGAIVPSMYNPRSLSVSEMLKLGKLGHTTSTVVNIFSFDMESLSWSKVPQVIEFSEEKQPIGTGGFRKAFKATSKHPEFSGTTWVIKRYIPEALQCIAETKQTVQEHNRKVVQMHLLARNLAGKLEKKVQNDGGTHAFGKMLRYRKIFHGEIDSKEFVTVEEFIPGIFTKYINNTGLTCCNNSNIIAQKAECLVHFSYEKSDKQLMLVDIQGNGHDLFDPEIASAELMDSDMQYMFCTGNLSNIAITNFISNHKCNMFCHILELVPL